MLPAYQAIARLPRPLWILAAANLINRCGWMALAYLPVYLVKVLHQPLQLAGLLTACYSTGSLLAAPLSARLCRSLGAVQVMGLSLLSSGCLMGLLPLIVRPGILAPYTLTLGCLAELCRPAGYVAINQLSSPDQKRSAFTLHRLALNVGMSIGPALGGILAAFSYNWLFWADGASSIAAGLVLTLSGLRSARAVGPESSNDRHPLGPHFPRFLLGQGLSMLVVGQVFSGLPLYLVRFLGRPEVDLGILYTLNTTLIILFEPTFSHKMAHWPLRRSLALGNLFLGLGLGSLAIDPSYACIVAGFLVFTLGEMLQAASGPSYVGRSVHPDSLARANAWFVGVGSLSIMVSPPLAAFLLQHWGGPGLWTVIGALGLLASLVMGTLPSESLPQSLDEQ